MRNLKRGIEENVKSVLIFVRRKLENKLKLRNS